MLLTELAVQNLKGFPPSARLSLQKGVNAVVSPQADPLRVIAAVLFPAPSDAELRVPGAGPHRAALTIEAKDGHSYRLIRDFSGGRTLLRSAVAGGEVQRLSDEAEEIARFLHSELEIPNEEIFLGQLMLDPRTLPSSRARVPPKVVGEDDSASALPPSGAFSAPRSLPDEPSRADARHWLARLRLEFEQAGEFERNQERLYALQGEQSELEALIEPSQKLDRQLREAESRLEGFEVLRQLSEGMGSRLRRYPELIARRDAALKEVAEKKEKLEESLEEPPGWRELVSQRLFSLGLLAALLAVALALVFDFRLLFLLGIIGASASAFAALRWVDGLEEADVDVRRIEELEHAELRIRKQAAAELEPVQKLLEALKLSQVEEVLAQMEDMETCRTRAMALGREWRGLQRDSAWLEQKARLEKVNEEVTALEARLAASSYTREDSQILKEIVQCQELLGLDGRPAKVLVLTMERAALLSGASVAELIPAIEERLRQYLLALSHRRFTALRPSASGVQVVAANGATGPFLGLGLADQDAVFLAVQLALFEMVAAPRKLPLFVGDPLRLVDPSLRGLFIKMLRSFRGQSQILIHTSSEPPEGVADHVVRVEQPAGSAPESESA